PGEGDEREDGAVHRVEEDVIDMMKEGLLGDAPEGAPEEGGDGAIGADAAVGGEAPEVAVDGVDEADPCGRVDVGVGEEGLLFVKDVVGARPAAEEDEGDDEERGQGGPEGGVAGEEVVVDEEADPLEDGRP